MDRLGSEVGGEWGGRRKAPPPPGTCPGVAWQRKQVRGAGHQGSRGETDKIFIAPGEGVQPVKVEDGKACAAC